MQIKSVITRVVHIPLQFRFSQSNNAGTNESMAIITEIRTATGISGFGECCPRTYVTGESVEDVLKDIQVISPELERLSIDSAEEIRALLLDWTAQKIGPSSRCGLELALLDAWSRTRQAPLVALLDGTPREALSYSLILPMLKPKYLAGLFAQLKGLQPPDIKLKVDRDLEGAMERIAVLQQFFGQDMPVRVDVNGGWTLEEAERFIPQLITAGVTSFEEPVAVNRPEDMAGLTQQFGNTVSIMADESLLTFTSARELIRNGAANHFNLKISKLGGIFSTLEIYRLATEHGIPCQLGAHFGETGILTAAGVLFASLAGELTAYEGAFGDRLLEKDITVPSIRHDLSGKLVCRDLLGQYGLMTQVNTETLEAYSRPV